MIKLLSTLGACAALALAATGCGGSSPRPAAAGSSGTGPPPVVIGSANFTENELLAYVYADALKAKGVPVTVKPNIGSREIYYRQLASGALTVFPEYNGALLSYLRPQSTAASTAAVDRALAAALPASLEALTPAAAQDKDSVTVTQAFATAHHLTSIADLVPLESTLVLGGPPEFKTRHQGLAGLARVYGLRPKEFKPLDEAGPLSIAALRDGTVQAADIFTTDPAVAQYHFVALADPKNLFGAQNVIPVVNRKVATPLVVRTLDAVSAKLDTSTLTQLVAAVVDQHVDAQTVAAQFDKQVGLG